MILSISIIVAFKVFITLGKLPLMTYMFTSGLMEQNGIEFASRLVQRFIPDPYIDDQRYKKEFY